MAAVVIPLGNLDIHRQAAWEYVRAWWWDQAEVVTGVCDGPWSKGKAVAQAVAAAPDAILAVVDADIVTPGIRLETDSWCVPHSMLVRLTPEGTDLVLAGADIVEIGEQRRYQLERYRPRIGGGAVILSKAAYQACPIDSRFVGWGQEDEAWGIALRGLCGPPEHQKLTSYHLWHPPQPRLTRAVGSHASQALKRRYALARHDPTTMQALIQEGREAA